MGPFPPGPRKCLLAARRKLASKTAGLAFPCLSPASYMAYISGGLKLTLSLSAGPGTLRGIVVFRGPFQHKSPPL